MDDGVVAGIAKVPLAPPLGLEMMGYGLRQGLAEGTLDPLFARAAYLRGDAPLLLVSLDVCLLAPSQAGGVRARIAAATGIAERHIAVLCIHTHAGPDTGLGALLAGRNAPPHVAALLDAAVEAGAAAVRAAVPARVGLGAATLGIGRSRREAGGAVDAAARIVRIDRRDGTPLAVLWLHGCHPTALGHENLLYSADWPGAAHAEIERALEGALSLFVLSAHADVDPRTRGLQDLAVANKSLGVDAGTMRALGREAGSAVARAALTIATEPALPIGSASALVSVPVHGGADPERAEAALAVRRAAALAALDLPPDAEVRTQELYRRSDALASRLPPSEARARIAAVRLFLRDRTAPYFAGSREPRIEVQALRIGDARWLGLPLEPTVRVGLEWSRRLGSEAAAVLSIANGWLRYLPHTLDFEGQFSEQGYEVLMSTLVPEAAGRLLEAGQALHAGLGP